MKLTIEETKERLNKLAQDSMDKWEEIGETGEKPEFITLVNALAYLG